MVEHHANGEFVLGLMQSLHAILVRHLYPQLLELGQIFRNGII